MKNKLLYSFEDDLEKRLKNPDFKKEWDKSNLDYQIARQVIHKRLLLKMSQRELARKVKTTQAIISRVETAVANPTLGLLQRIGKSLHSQLIVEIR